MGVEWIREGDPWPETEDPELRAHLAEDGVLSLGKSGRLHMRFVGVIVHRDRTLVSLPKVRTTAHPRTVHRQVLRAMRHYQQWVPTHHEPSPFLNGSPEKGPVSGLAAADWMIRDFLDHGLLRRMETAHEVGGAGTVNWRRTIETVPAAMSRGRPVYLETITHRSQTDNRNFATRLHCYLLERLSNEYGPVLDLEPVVLDHEPVERLDALPAAAECEARLIAEQRQTYSQRGIDLLAMMIATVRSLEMETARGLSLYGTSYFHHVWEAACAIALGNEVERWLPYLPSPRWISIDGSWGETDTFIPDLVTPVSRGELLIGDAKYYRPSMPPILANVPGVNDVAKQIWYKECLRGQALKQGFGSILNAFLFPADSAEISLIGHVELPTGGERVDAIAVPFLPALAAYAGDRSHDSSAWRSVLAGAIKAVA